MESKVCFNKNAKDSEKFKKIQIIEFYWFKQTNNRCQCFHCFCFQKKENEKMSGNGKRVMFDFLFPLFQQYWLFCREYENHALNLGQFLLLQSRVFEKIHLEWRTFKWDEKELYWICSRIHSKDP